MFLFCAGIENRIAYLQEQGINNVWVNSFYLSDNILDGDDIVDHKKINPIMGDRVTFDGLKKIMRKKGKTKAHFYMKLSLVIIFISLILGSAVAQR